MNFLKTRAARKTVSVETAGRLTRAQKLQRDGNLVSAEVLYRQILELDRHNWESLNGLLSIEIQNGNLEKALVTSEALVAGKPENAEGYYKRANVLNRLGRWESALVDYDRAIALNPRYAKALCKRGFVLEQLGRWDHALESYDRALDLDQLDYLSHCNRGSVLRKLKRFDESLVSYDRSIVLKSDYVEAHFYRGMVLYELRRFEAAAASHEEAIKLTPSGQSPHAQLFRCRGLALRQLKRLDEAVVSFEQAIALESGRAEVYVDLANVLLEIGRFDAALTSYNHALILEPNYVEALQGRGFALLYLKQLDAAITSFDLSLSLNSDQKYLPGLRRHLKMQICDWDDLEADIDRLATGLLAGTPLSTPFPMLSLIDSALVHGAAARLWAEEHFPLDDSLGPIPLRRPTGKIHIAYFSPDFREHPVSLLTSELFETHDRTRFHVTAISFGPNTRDSVRTRLERAFERFIEVGDKSDMEGASLVRSIGVDIAVDLAGFTEHARTGVFALRAAPIQVSYLGYLGTMAVPYMDYILADQTIIPSSDQEHYVEKIIYLPSYQANDSKRRISERTFTREELGLPQDGFVFACFNANYKIMPATFATWMRILDRVPGSNLYLFIGYPIAKRNVLREAERRGIDSRRIVFGEQLAFEEYLARFRVMDLFLDTLPYNAGTTASDALWAGLPVLTCVGRTFAGRVAASLLTAINLPELIADTPSRYEQLAVEMATSPTMMANIRRKLAANRLPTLLFDTARFTRSLETAYAKVCERYYAGLQPEHIYVARSG